MWLSRGGAVASTASDSNQGGETLANRAIEGKPLPPNTPLLTGAWVWKSDEDPNPEGLLTFVDPQNGILGGHSFVESALKEPTSFGATRQMTMFALSGNKEVSDDRSVKITFTIDSGEYGTTDSTAVLDAASGELRGESVAYLGTRPDGTKTTITYRWTAKRYQAGDAAPAQSRVAAENHG